jgi:hypothetical protein
MTFPATGLPCHADEHSSARISDPRRTRRRHPFHLAMPRPVAWSRGPYGSAWPWTGRAMHHKDTRPLIEH